jgi:bifunctional non-homologous end joining protein LigD
MANAKKREDPFPDSVSPMLAALIKEPFDSPEFVHEVKWDGYRIIAFVRNGKVRLDSRSGLNYTSKYSPVVNALKNFQHDFILDGEVVVLNDDGLPDFDALQKNLKPDHLVYYVFDLLYLDGVNLMDMPLEVRKEQLETLISYNPVIRYSDHFTDGLELYKNMEKIGMEGIVSKRWKSLYVPGQRGNNWYKVPTVKRQEFVIGGWVESDARSFRTLLFGAYEGKDLKWIGHAGGGFKDKEMPGILKKLRSLEIKKSPFVNEVEYSEGEPHWVKPVLVGNFKFAAWTASGKIRKPAIFLGFREDKNAKDVVREVPKDTVDVEKNKTAASKSKASKHHRYLNEDTNWKVADKIKVEQREVLDLTNCAIELTDVDREIWNGFPKGRLIQYYHEVCSLILPHIKNRPQSLNLKLNGAGGPTTFIKDMEGRQPECAEVFSDKRRVHKAGKRNVIDYLVCNNEETLLFMINEGCIDVNPWASTVADIEKPTYLWIDLDPTIPEELKGDQKLKAEDEGFQKAITVAQATKKILDKHKLKGLLKTSGKTGIHVYVPCSAFQFEQARAIAYKLCDEIHAVVPKISTRSELKSHRGSNVYIDAGQNDYADTLAAAYSVRPYHLPTISTPIEWKELNAKLDRRAFTIDTIMKRIKKKGDMFIDTLDVSIAEKNSRILEKFLQP